MTLYLHKLPDMNIKLAEVESVEIIRGLRKQMKLPVTYDAMHQHFVDFLVSRTDLEELQNALTLIPRAIDRIDALYKRNDPVFEAVNLQRAIQVLEEIPTALKNNLDFAQNMEMWQVDLINNMTEAVNMIPSLKSNDEKAMVNEHLNKIFQKLLRSDQLEFNAKDIVNEDQLSSITGLADSLLRGFLYHVALEEEIHKVPFERIRLRIPSDKQQEGTLIEQDIKQVRRAVERAYNINMRMIMMSLHLYSMIKWAMNG